MSLFESRTLTIELRPDTWANLERRAAKIGLSLDHYMQSCIELNVPLLEGADQP